MTYASMLGKKYDPVGLVTDSARRGLQKLTGYSIVAILIEYREIKEDAPQTINFVFTNIALPKETLSLLLTISIIFYLISSVWQIYCDAIADRCNAIRHEFGVKNREQVLNRILNQLSFVEENIAKAEPTLETLKKIRRLNYILGRYSFSILARSIIVDLCVPFGLAIFALMKMHS